MRKLTMGDRKTGFLTLMAALALTGASALAATPALAAAGSPLAQAVMEGKNLFEHETFGGNGNTCETCHTAGGRGQGHMPGGMTFPSLSNAAAIFPRYKPKDHQVVTLTQQVQGCIAGALQGRPPAADSLQMTDLVAYLTSLSEGKPIHMGGKPR